MRTGMFLAVLLLFLATLLPATVTRADEVGSRPRNVAVSSDGRTVLISSMGSTSITQFHDGARSHVEVGAPTWGVCFLDDDRAVFSHVGFDGLSRLVARVEPLICVYGPPLAVARRTL